MLGNYIASGEIGSCRFGPPTKAQVAVLIRLRKASEIVGDKHPEVVASKDWNTLLRETQLNYEGEVVKTALPLTVAQVEPTLPPQGIAASIDAAELASGLVKSFLLDPQLCLLSETDTSETAPPPRMHGEEHELVELADLLERRGIIVEINLEQALHRRGKPVLNSWFGVEKSKDKKFLVKDVECCLLRLIMNLVNPNVWFGSAPGY
jgi:hypothetical protein